MPSHVSRRGPPGLRGLAPLSLPSRPTTRSATHSRHTVFFLFLRSAKLIPTLDFLCLLFPLPRIFFPELGEACSRTSFRSLIRETFLEALCFFIDLLPETVLFKPFFHVSRAFVCLVHYYIHSAQWPK